VVRRGTQAARQLRVDATQVCSIGAQADAGQSAARISAGGQFNQHLAHRGDVVFEHACKLGAEGIVSKRVDAPYRSGPHAAWVKVRNPASIAVQRERSENWNK
jgi:hypothetical protein